MILTPDQYTTTSAYDLLRAASLGHVAVDQRLLHAILDDPDRTLPDIVRFAAEDPEDARIDLEEELVLIARHLQAPELVPFLIECVRAYDDDVPDTLVETLCGFGETALEPLLALYRTIGPDSGSEVPFLLATLGVRDARVENILREVSEVDPEEGAFCIEIYEEISRAPSEIEPFEIWNEYPEESGPPFALLTADELLEFLEAPDARLRAGAALSLGGHGELPRQIIKRIHGVAQTDPDPNVRGAAWRSLCFEVEDRALMAEMRKRLLDDSSPAAERAGLIVALAPVVREPEFRSRVLELFALPDTRAAAVEAMWRSVNKIYIDQVKQALGDPNPDVCEQALIAVGYLRMSDELGRVKAMFDDPDRRPAALLAYALTIPTDISRDRMERLFGEIEELAGGFEPEEVEIVGLALDQRLIANGHEPLFGSEE